MEEHGFIFGIGILLASGVFLGVLAFGFTPDASVMGGGEFLIENKVYQCQVTKELKSADKR